MPAATAMMISPATSAPLLGTGAKLMARMRLPTSATDRTPPRLSTRSDVSLTCDGMYFAANTNATTANGRVIRKTDPQ